MLVPLKKCRYNLSLTNIWKLAKSKAARKRAAEQLKSLKHTKKY